MQGGLPHVPSSCGYPGTNSCSVQLSDYNFALVTREKRALNLAGYFPGEKEEDAQGTDRQYDVCSHLRTALVASITPGTSFHDVCFASFSTIVHLYFLIPLCWSTN